MPRDWLEVFQGWSTSVACFWWLFSRCPSSGLVHFFGGEGSPTKIDYRKKGTLILTSLLEDLVCTSQCGEPGKLYRAFLCS